MQLYINLPGDKLHQDLIQLNNFILKQSIDGLNGSELTRINTIAPNTMGVIDITNSITTIIEAAEKPLIELIKCLQLYVENYRTEITIPTKNGNVVIRKGRAMSDSELKKLITEIIEAGK